MEAGILQITAMCRKCSENKLASGLNMLKEGTAVLLEGLIDRLQGCTVELIP